MRSVREVDSPAQNAARFAETYVSLRRNGVAGPGALASFASRAAGFRLAAQEFTIHEAPVGFGAHGTFCLAFRSVCRMPPKLQVHFLPTLVSPAQFEGGLVVVIDVLRASTTICHALAAGAKAVIPCLKVADARALAAGLGAGEATLGGEREGLPIEGFDLGNSPEEYTRESVGRKTVVFTTTNGAKAAMQCRGAGRVLIGAFVNLTAIGRQCAEQLAAGGTVHLLCSGTRGAITGEDVWFAGAVTAHLLATPDCCSMNDEARLAAAAWSATGAELCHERLAEGLLSQTQGGRNLHALGLQRDVRAAAEVDRFDFAPQLDQESWSILRL